MHVRMNMLVGDPARLDEATRYLEGSVRPHVEAQPGNRGIAVLTNADLGICVIASYWDSADVMAASEQAVEVPRKELTELIKGTVTVEKYEVAVFARRSRPPAGAGVRLTWIDADPAYLDGAIAEFRSTGVPALTQMPGLCSTQFLADRETGHCIAVTAWQDHAAMSVGRSGVATLRANLTAVTHSQIRMVEEFTLMSSSVREGDTRTLIERDIELWNSRDRAGWLALADLHRLELDAPGGVQMSGQDAADAIWAMWHEAFPDHRLEIVTIHADDRGGVHEGRFVGTHTGTLHTPAGEIAPTGRILDARFCSIYEVTTARSPARTCTSIRRTSWPSSGWPPANLRRPPRPRLLRIRDAGQGRTGQDGAVKVIVLSDTHAPRRWRCCPPAVAAQLRGADLILHAGDVCTAAVLDELAGYAPVRAVLGNNDGPDVAAWGAQETLELDLDGLGVAMIHDACPAAGRPARMRRRFPAAGLVIFGHSHIPLDHAENGQRIFNPGSPTDRRRQPRGTLGRLDITRGRLASVRLIPVTPEP